jgi:LITAF-like zinc ribbon domain
MENTPNRVLLECFSTIKSSSSHNTPGVPFLLDSPEIQKYREDGFSTSILINLEEEASRPISKLLNITQIRPGYDAKKILLPLFYDNTSEDLSNPLPRLKRSLSVDSAKSYMKNNHFDTGKVITTTTFNTNTNPDVAEISPEFVHEGFEYQYETDLKKSGVGLEFPEFTVNPTLAYCYKCKSKNLTIVEKEKSYSKHFFKILRIFCCCVGGFITGTQTFSHICPNCSVVLFRLNA